MYSRAHHPSKPTPNSTSVSNTFQARPFSSTEDKDSQRPEPTPGLENDQEKRPAWQAPQFSIFASETPPQPPPVPNLQTKLNIGQPGDRYEREADQGAGKVVQRLNIPSPQPRIEPSKKDSAAHFLEQKIDNDHFLKLPASPTNSASLLQRQPNYPDTFIRQSPHDSKITNQTLAESIQRARDNSQPPIPVTDVSPAIIQLSPLSDELEQVWHQEGKGIFFERLRHVQVSDPDVLTFITSNLNGDDLWLATNIFLYGIEANWPIHLRVEREMKGWGDSGGKGAVFEILRAANGTQAGNAQLTASLNRVFGAGTDDIWLAQNLQAHGREANWPIHLRIEREMKGWSDSGGVPAVFAILRSANGTEAGNAALTATLNRIFASDPDNLQVALHWQAHGAVDQHAGTALPDAARQRAIAAELNPTSTSSSGGTPLEWDGGSASTLSATQKTAARNALKTAVTNAMVSHLTRAMPGIRRVAGARRLPMTQFEGAGRAAKQVTDARFGALGSAAALTPAQASQRSGFQFRGSGPNQTLFDAFDPAQRRAAGHPIDPMDLANWISETERASQNAQQAHHFNPNRGGEEETFLQNEILNPFVAAHRPDLEQYDLFGFAISGDRIVVGSSVMLGLSDRPGSGGEPSPAERAAKWSVWKTLVHEYIHTLAHPVFNSAARGNRIMIEGFCEMFTKEVLLAELPRVRTNATLCNEVEGGTFTPPTPAIIGGYDPGEYAAYLQHAENIRDRVIGGAEGANAVKAAFFQGHVELLGLNPHGTPATPSGGRNLITVPSGITTVAALAMATGVSQADILAANSGLTAASSLPAQVNVPGCRDHVVVVAEDRSGTRTPETKAQIAIQNGVTIADLDRANPGVSWGGLTVGQHILIPRH